MSVDTEKKPKAAAKPRKAAAKTKAPAATVAVPTHEEIAILARKYWGERGWADGAAEQDWLRAERELSQMAL
jgi:Protein of unknown function (DUF2934)